MRTLHVVVELEVEVGIGLLDGKIYHAEEEGVEEEEGGVLAVLLVDVVGKRITTMKHATSIGNQTHFDDLKDTRRFSFLFDVKRSTYRRKHYP